MWIYFSDSFGGNCRASTKRKRLFAGERVAPRVLPRPTLDWHEVLDRPQCPCNFLRTSAHFIYDEFLDSLRSKGLNIVPQCFHPFSNSGNHLSCFTSYNCVARTQPLPSLPSWSFKGLWFLVTTVNNFAHLNIYWWRKRPVARSGTRLVRMARSSYCRFLLVLISCNVALSLKLFAGICMPKPRHIKTGLHKIWWRALKADSRDLTRLDSILISSLTAIKYVHNMHKWMTHTNTHLHPPTHSVEGP